jgi:serine/threonine protein kinase
MEALLGIKQHEMYFRMRRGDKDKPLSSYKPAIAFEHLGIWFAQACESLARLHAAGLMHGFLTPHSLLIDSSDMRLRIGNLEKIQPASDAYPVEPFDPHNLIHPPERLLLSAKRETVPFTSAYTAIEDDNYGFEAIQLFLPEIQYDRKMFSTVYESAEDCDRTKGDVWMLGFSFLREYRNLMMWSQTLSAAFYRTEHLRFKMVLEHMLHGNPARRISAADAFTEWTGSPLHLNESQQEESTVAAAVSDDAEKIHRDESSNSDQPLAHPKKRRLVLNARRDPSAHNKTRKNLRS